MTAYTIENRSGLYTLIVNDRRTHLNATDCDNILKYEDEIKALTAMIDACNDADEKKILVKRRGIVRGTLTRKIAHCSKAYPVAAPVVECQIVDSISIEYDADTDCVDTQFVDPIELSGLAWVIASDKVELAETRRHLEHDDCVDPAVVSRTIELIERRIARNEELLKRTTTPATMPISSVDDSIKMLQQCVEEMGASNPPAPTQRPFSATVLSSILSHTDMPLLLDALREHPATFANADDMSVGESIQCIHAQDGTQYDIFAVCMPYNWDIQVTRLEHAISTRPYTPDDAIALANSLLDIRDAGQPQYMPIILRDRDDWLDRVNVGKSLHHATRFQRHGLDVVFRVLYLEGSFPLVNIVNMR